MTFADLTAAMWHGRQITITGDSGRTVTAVPLGVQRNTARQWEVLFEGPDGRGAMFVRFDRNDA